MKVELHCHTKYSHDSLLSHRLLYMKCVRKGIKYIAITEHNNLKGAQEFREYCRNRGEKVHVIPGEEIMTSEGEVIGLYLKDEIPRDLSPEDTIDRIKQQGGIVYVPHPYDEKRYKTVLSTDAIARNADSIDCIEAYNGRNISPEYEIKQNEIAERFHARKVIGSDAHTLIEIGRNYLETDIGPDTREAFLSMLDNCAFVKAPCIGVAHKLTKYARLIKLIGSGRFDEIHRIIVKRRGKNQ